MAKSGDGARGSDRINFSEIASAALNAAEDLLRDWLPNGHKVGPEWRSINPTRSDQREGSFSVNVVTGKWGDFASGDGGGDLISLCAYLFYSNDQVAAARDIAQRLGIFVPPPNGSERSRNHGSLPAASPQADKSLIPDQAVSGAEAKRRTDWVPVRRVPDHATEAPKAHVKRGLPERVWHYRDGDGATLGYVFRFKTSDGGKEILPVCWAKHAEHGREEWRWMHFAEPRCLYGLDRLADKPDATVLVVEGEKCADVAHALFPDLAVISWPGGGHAVHKADWSPLAGRKVVIWPDADAKREKLSKEEKAAGIDPLSKPYLALFEQPGVKAARAVAKVLQDLKCAIWMVALPAPGDWPDGYDVADMEADGKITAETASAWLRDNSGPWTPNADLSSDDGSPTPLNAAAGEDKPPAEKKEKDGWYWNLHRNQKGEISAVVANVYDVLVNDYRWEGLLGFDQFSQRIVKLRPPPWPNGEEGEWQDQDTVHLGIWVTRRYRFAPGRDVTAQAVDVAARNNTFDPVVRWLRNLPVWDGNKRIGSWLTRYIGAEADTEDQRKYLTMAGGWFLMGLCARALNPGCKFDYSLILEGDQGKSKSTILAALVGDQWFSDAELDFSNKDSMIALQGKWLFEIAEMGAMARSDEKRQKAFLSRRFDEFRMPFATTFVKLPRRVCFSGTTNEWEWNKDPTGGRRFWPTKCGTLDVQGLIEAREQLFAEALHYYDAGHRYWPTPDEQKKYFDPEQLKREQQDSFIDVLHDWVYSQVSDFSLAHAITEGLQMDASKMTRDTMTRVGIALRKLGCTRFEKRNGMTRFWYKPPARNGAGSTAGGDAGEGSERSAYGGF